MIKSLTVDQCDELDRRARRARHERLQLARWPALGKRWWKRHMRNVKRPGWRKARGQ